MEPVVTTAALCGARSEQSQRLFRKLNGIHHARALTIFAVIVLAHWAEHLAQAVQIYLLGWKPTVALGALGFFFPWLIKSETLHYGYALIMLGGLWALRSGFVARPERMWWTIALVIQFWHHIEHALLLSQAIIGANFFGRPVPTSVVQLWFPRVELHLFYNTIVFIPMVVAMFLHLFPPAEQSAKQECTCAWHPRRLAT
jgi:hypothetical protein